MAESTSAATARVDAWTWAVRLFPTRSAATAAVKAGHVKVNTASAKPAQAVKVGDTIRIRDTRGERIVKVLGLIDKRVGASVAVTLYDDMTPPAPAKGRALCDSHARSRRWAAHQA
jgi:ribosome-associated heat shock protein Hsp15